MNIDGFLTHLRTRGCSTGTVISYRSELLKFEAFLREKKLQVNQIKPKHVEMYLRTRDPAFDHKPASTRRRFAVLSSFYDFLGVMADGHIRNPVRPMRRPRHQPPRPKPLEDDQIDVLIQGITDTRDAAIIGLLLNSGLRLSELCSLNRDSIQVERISSSPGVKVIGVGRVMGKGQKEREFLVDLESLKLLHRYLSERSADDKPPLFLSNRGRRINPRTVQHILRSWCKRLNLPPFHPHKLRTTFASRLSKRGVPTAEISLLLGHASLDTTKLYIRPDMQKSRTEYFAAYEKFNQ